ncbi:MAG: molybdopterin molybdotransferase MoeA, partial [Planctomycetes bacterium]|nr:molybdopterin molybdotransferase MoeA [Planctomycetota bacterium]
MLSPAEAATTILRSVGHGAVEHVPIMDALGRVLAVDVTSPIDLPQRDNSAMDGFAVRSEDVRGKCPVELEIVEHIPAGAVPVETLDPGQCSRIFTGAHLPLGSDGVTRQEYTTRISDTVVRIEKDADASGNIRRRGEDLRRNSVVVSLGTELKPAHLGLLASVAQDVVPVYRKPRVAVMTSGDEVADLDDKAAILDGSKIGSSNTYTLLSAVKQSGGIPIALGIARDDPRDIRDRMTSTQDVDLLVTSGGVSVGEHDHLRAVFEDLGGELRFWRIKMRPGKPVAFGILRGMPWIGLPGNPVSTMVTFELLVRPAIRKMLGLAQPYRRTVTVRMSEQYKSGTSRRDFVRAIVEMRGGELSASTTGAQGSGILTSMAKANALLI